MRAAVVSRRYKWQQRWQVDRTACTAAHESGLVVYFTATPAATKLFGGGHVIPNNLATVRAALETKNGPHNTPIMISRLSKEAAIIWQEANRAVER